MKYLRTLALLLVVLIGMEPINAINNPNKMPDNNELFFIDGSQGKIASKIALPILATGEKCPMVILSHGFGGHMTFHLWKPIIQILNENGIGVPRYDFNDCGLVRANFTI